MLNDLIWCCICTLYCLCLLVLYFPPMTGCRLAHFIALIETISLGDDQLAQLVEHCANDTKFAGWIPAWVTVSCALLKKTNRQTKKVYRI